MIPAVEGRGNTVEPVRMDTFRRYKETVGKMHTYLFLVSGAACRVGTSLDSVHVEISEREGI